MNIKALCFYVVLLHSTVNGVQLGVNNGCSKKVEVEFSFLIEKAAGLAKIVSGKLTAKPGKFQVWQDDFSDKEKKEHKTYLTSCAINGKPTAFGKNFEGDAWYIDVHTQKNEKQKNETYASLVKYLDCYLGEKRCAGGLPGLQNLAQLLALQTDPEIVHSLRRRTQLFLKLTD